MSTDSWSREQILSEVLALRARLADLEQTEAGHRQAEESLRASERCLRALIESSPDAVFLIEPAGTIRAASGSTVRMLGYRPDELVGGNVFSLTHPDDLATVRQVFDLMLATPGEGVPFHFRFQHKDGAWRWLDGKGTNMLAEPAIGAVVCHYRDVSSQVKADEERQRLLHNLSERVKELIVLHQSSRLLQDQGLTVREILSGLVGLLPAGFQYPDCAARIGYNDLLVQTPRYEESPWKIQSAFRTRDGRQGTLDVVYREEKPHADEGPFLAEERHLLDSIAEMLQLDLNRRLAEEALKRSESRLSRPRRSLTWGALSGPLGPLRGRSGLPSCTASWDGTPRPARWIWKRSFSRWSTRRIARRYGRRPTSH